MDSMNRIAATYIPIALGLVLSTSTRAQTSDVSFERRFAASASNASELAPLPTVGIAPSALSISASLADVLTEAVNDELSRAPDGSQFQVLLRSDGGRVRWMLAAVTAPRGHYLSLAPGFTAELSACLQTLESDSIELTATLALISGVLLQDAPARQAATRATAQMLREWKSSRCSVARNASPLIERQRARIVAATQGMLTGRFDALMFRGQNLVDLIAQLGVLFFDRDGLWATNRGARLAALLESTLTTSFLAFETSTSLTETEFPSFWSWVLEAGRLQPKLTDSFIDTVAGACVPNLVRMRAPFQLQRCVASRALNMTTLRTAATTALAAEPGVAP